jgi:hypothetical protein
MAIPRVAEDLACILRDVGVLVTLGASSTYGSVHATSEEELGRDAAPGLDASLVTFVVATGGLEGLANGVILTAAGVPYRVHRHFEESEGTRTKIVAYPTTFTAPEFWIRGSTVLAWASRSAGAAASDPIDLDALEGIATLLLDAAAATAGVNPTLNVAVHHADLLAGPYADSGLHFVEVGAVDSFQALVLDYRDESVKRYVKLVPAIVGTFWFQVALADAVVSR